MGISASYMPEATITVLVEPIVEGDLELITAVLLEFPYGINEQNYEDILQTAAVAAFGVPSDWAKAEVEENEDENGYSTGGYTVTITLTGLTEDTANSIQSEGSGELVNSIKT